MGASVLTHGRENENGIGSLGGLIVRALAESFAVIGVTVEDEQLRVIEDAALVSNAFIGEGSHEVRDITNLGIVADQGTDPLDIGIEVVPVGIREVTATSIEFDHPFQGLCTTVVEIRTGQFDVAKIGGLERSVDSDALATLRWEMRIHFEFIESFER